MDFFCNYLNLNCALSFQNEFEQIILDVLNGTVSYYYNVYLSMHKN